MKYTGERLTTEVQITFGVIEHLSRYAFASSFVKGKKVLDAACGEGYGTFILSSISKDIIGIDIDETAIECAKNKYLNNNLKFVKADITNMPIENNSMDCIVSFETIEHTTEQDDTILEFKRILKKDGLLIISSPSKENYKKRDPNNKYHKKELTDNEFRNLIERYFKFTKFYEQYFVVGSFIKNINSEQSKFYEFSGSFDKISNSLSNEDDYYNKKFFNIIIASDFSINNSNINFLFDGVNALNTFLENKIKNQNKNIINRTKGFLLYPFFLFYRIFDYLFTKFKSVLND